MPPPAVQTRRAQSARTIRILASAALLLSILITAGPATADEDLLFVAAARDGVGRIVFAQPGPLPESVRLHGRDLRITFRRPVTGDTAILPELLDEVVGGVTTMDGGRTLVLSLSRQFRLRTVTAENAVAVELFPPDRAALPPLPPAMAAEIQQVDGIGEAASTAAGALAETAQVAALAAPRPLTAAEAAAVEPAASVAIPQPGAAAPSVAIPAQDTPAASVAIPRPDAPASAPQTTDESAGATDQDQAGQAAATAAADAPVLAFRPGRDGAFSLTFRWPAAARLAAWRRDGHIWIVFDQESRFDLAAVVGSSGGRLDGLEAIETPGATVLRLPVADGINPRATGGAGDWIITVGPDSGVPEHPVPVRAEPRALGEPRVFLPAPSLGEPLVVRGADGKVWILVPLGEAGTGVVSDRRFPQFRLLAAAQGIVVEPRADGVAVRPVDGGIAITAGGGLLVSESGADDGPVQWPGEDRADARLFDFADWRLENDNSFLINRQALQQAVAMASFAEVDQQRMRLARFLFAHGFAADAIGTLLLVDPDGTVASEPAYRALVGAAALMVSDRNPAARELMRPELDGSADVSIWRGVLHSGYGDWAAARRFFTEGAGLLANYAEPYRAKIGLLAARASIEADDPDEATRWLDIVNGGDPDPGQQAQGRYLRGVAVELAGQPDDALMHWNAVIESEQLPAALLAQIARMELLVERGTMAPEQAIQTLDSLRFAWRGDETEMLILRRLGEWQVGVGMWQEGLENLERVTTLFPDHAVAAETRAWMEASFTRLYLNGGTRDLAPLLAIALWNGFGYLAPGGDDGARMVRNLVDRLIEVDLLDRAAGLLEEQLGGRLAGEERARVGARLADIHLLDRQPARALAALDVSGAPDLPVNLAVERQLLRASAHGGIGDLTAALAAIATIHNHRANLLRARLFWQNRDWPAAAVAFEDAVRQVDTSSGTLSDSDSRLVLSWASALAMSGNDEGLMRLRRRFDAILDAGPWRDTYRVLAYGTDVAVSDFDALVARVAEVDNYGAFMDNYREQLVTSGSR